MWKCNLVFLVVLLVTAAFLHLGTALGAMRHCCNALIVLLCNLWFRFRCDDLTWSGGLVTYVHPAAALLVWPLRVATHDMRPYCAWADQEAPLGAWPS
jgi:hypothetical protein